jgi:hypothetical protein
MDYFDAADDSIVDKPIKLKKKKRSKKDKKEEDSCCFR